MFCQFCGAELPDGARFCPKCGQNCSMQPEVSSDNSFSFDDELSPIEKPAKPQKKSASKKPHRNQVVQKEKLESAIDQERIYSENGSGNVWTGVCDNRFYMDDIDLKESTSYGLSVRVDASNTFHKVLDDIAVESFKINKRHQFIVYRVGVKERAKLRFELWVCDLNGKNKQKIAGDTTDNVNYFAVTDDWIFVVIKNRKDEQFVYQISSNLQSVDVILKGIDIRRRIAANNQYLYYAVFEEPNSPDPNRMALVEYNIKSKKEQVVFYKENGIKEFQLYRNHIVLSTYTNCMFSSSNQNGLWLLDPRQDLCACYTSITCKVTNLNCYADHIFYTDDETGYVYALSMIDDSVHKVYQRRAQTLNIAWGLLQLIDYDTAGMITLELFGRFECKSPGYTGWKLPLPTVGQSGDPPRYISAPPKENAGEVRPDNEMVIGSENHIANSGESSSETPQSDIDSETNSKSTQRKSGTSNLAIIASVVAVVMVGIAIFGKKTDEPRKSDNSYQQASNADENITQSNNDLKPPTSTQPAITISNFIGDYSYDASFENPDGTWTDFCYSLSIEPENDGVLVSEMWRGMYIFCNDWASKNDLDGNTLYFVVKYGDNAGTHSLTYIPAEQSPYGSDTIYIDDDTDMPFTKDGYVDNSYSYSDNRYDDSYILPTDSQYITESDLNGMSKEQVSLARNEIYARYGYSFGSETVRKYFLQQSWYYEDPAINANTFGVNNLSDCERINLETIQQYERDMGWK